MFTGSKLPSVITFQAKDSVDSALPERTSSSTRPPGEDAHLQPAQAHHGELLILLILFCQIISSLFPFVTHSVILSINVNLTTTKSDETKTELRKQQDVNKIMLLLLG